MKLLLTSGGLRNDELKQAFVKQLGRPVDQAKVAVIPTAAKHETDREWFDKDMDDLRSTGISGLGMVEISELSKSEWLPKLRAADVIFVEGGDVYFLRDEAVKSGFAEELPELLKTRLYVGVSAGTRLLNPDISVAALYYEPSKDPEGLGLVEFCVVPHMNSEHFKGRTPELIAPKVKNSAYATYLIDDDTAILIDGSMMQFVGGGKYVEYPK